MTNTGILICFFDFISIESKLKLKFFLESAQYVFYLCNIFFAVYKRIYKQGKKKDRRRKTILATKNITYKMIFIEEKK